MAPHLFRRCRATGYYVGLFCCFLRALARRSDRRVGVGASGPRPEGRRALARVPAADPCPTVDRLNTQRRTAPAACASGGVPPKRSPPGSARCLPAARRTITNTQCPGYRTAEPSDSPPWASRYERPTASPFASPDGPSAIGHGRTRRVAAGRVRGRDKEAPFVQLPRVALLMVAGPARRQGPRRLRGWRRRWVKAFPLDRVLWGPLA